MTPTLWYISGKVLTKEEIEMFNPLPHESATWFLHKQAAAAQLIAAGIQRKALLDVEEKGGALARYSTIIAVLATGAVFFQVVVNIIRLCLGR